MIKLLDLLLGKKDDCDCGCNDCQKETKLLSSTQISEGLQYHLDKNIALQETIYRYGSTSHLNLLNEVRKLYREGQIQLSEIDADLISTDIGRWGLYEGIEVPLDLPLNEEDEFLYEKDDKKKNPPLNKPKRGGSKKFYVYVRDPKTKRIKKVNFGDTTGLSAKIGNKKAAQAFAKRHKCDQAKDRTKARYWSCNLPRYAKRLGLSEPASRYW